MGTSRSLGHVSVLIMKEHLSYLQAFQNANPAITIEHVMLPDFDKPETVSLSKDGKDFSLVTTNLDQISNHPETEKGFCLSARMDSCHAFAKNLRLWE